jgi:hypothetical protein
MTSHVSSGELQRRLDTLRAERRAQVADPVTKLTAYVLADATVDADRLQNKLLVGAVNSAGEPMSGVIIDYRVIDENATGSTFVLDGNPIGSSFGVTEEGFALA